MTTPLTVDLDTVTKPVAAALAGLFSNLAGVTVPAPTAAGTSSGSTGATTETASATGAAAATGAGTTASTLPAVAAPVVSAADAITAKFFPADVGLAPFPSPENSNILRLGDLISGRPYLRASDGSVHQLVAPTADAPHGYSVNGHPTQGGGSGDSYNQLLVRAGMVYAQLAGGQWQQFNPGMGSMYNAGLPAALVPVTDASGTVLVAPPTVVPPLPTPSAIAPGSSGKTITVGSDQTYKTITDGFKAAAAGDTVQINAGTYKETPPAITVPLHVLLKAGTTLDCTGLTATLAYGKGAIVTAADAIIELEAGALITGVAMDQGNAQSTAGIRWDQGCGFLTVKGAGKISGNQNGIAGGGINTVILLEDIDVSSNGLLVDDGGGHGIGYCHNIYVSDTTPSLTMKNVTSKTPLGGHAVKSRAYNTYIDGLIGDATDGSVVDICDGSAGIATLTNSTITKPAGSNNHTVVGYAPESTGRGAGGMKMTGNTFNLLCDNPLFSNGSSGAVTLDTTNTFTGNKPTAPGGGVTGLPA